ncbi:MAG: glycosyltransferase [Candidatus Adlerbacteria bacterium]|nr:glycosyltransferase [Candidatus Adlerbacteria bacterium]
MRKILIFSLAYYPHVGGAEVAVKELTDRMLDIEFHMVTMRFSATDAKEEKIGNVLVHRVGFAGSSALHKFFFQFVAAWKASALQKIYHYDATWALMAHSAGVPAALFKIRHREVPYILNLQEGDPPKHIERRMLPLWPLFTRAFTKADVVQPLSNFLGAWARARGYTGPLVLIPNGVDVEKFSGIAVPHEGTVLITTSRLVHKNAIDDVIRALPLLPQNVVFKILGTGPDETALRALAKKEGVESRVKFLGYVPHDDMPRYLHTADIFIRPSRSEGQGASFIEAMAAGLPIIATAVGGIPDFLQDGETGFVVDVDSPQSIAAVVGHMIENPEEMGRVARQGQELSKSYEWGILAERMKHEVLEPLWKKQ